MATRGIHPVSIAHGDPDGHADAELVFESVPALARESGTLASTRAGNDYTTFLFAGPGAEEAAVAFTAAVLGIAPRWWRITPTATPVWR
ncbi:MAG: hypothetical protein JWN00_3834 [Actinomycetia bacterium]|nr:hypothetical protein [Actinomycetes bacterium]